MAPPVGTLRVGRYFLALLAIIAVLYAIVFWPGQRHTPKLGLDLVGGTQVIFTARTDNGTAPSSSSMDQAKQIIEERVNGTGVTEATVVIQGNNQLVVSIPGGTNADVQKLGAAAVLNFRGLVAPATQVACVSPTAVKSPGATSSATSAGTTSPSPASSASSSSGAATAPTSAATTQPVSKPPSSSLSGQAKSERLLKRASGSATPTTTAGTSAATAVGTSQTPTAASSSSPATTPSAATASTATSATAAPKCTATSVADIARAGKFTVPLTDTDFNKLSATNQKLLAAGLAQFDCASGQTEKDNPSTYFVACDSSGLAYLLGPVIVAGKQISGAAAQPPNIASGQTGWSVSLDLNDPGQKHWADYTKAHNINGADSSTTSGPTGCGATGTPCADYVSFTLDGQVISSPVNESTINGGTTQISGSFDSSSANDLADKLKYGALPLSFRADESQTVSATLGTAQLKSGLLAGGIGLALVVIYSLIYYRALGLVTIASLVTSGVLTYGCLVMLGTQIGFTLSLAGIAGFIVAVGITADSFVVFFERLKDEVHEGRSVRVAVPRAWVRARRTILSADTVSFLAAAILYYFAAGDVKGFAFTLGLSTILDLVVVFLFTHPLISWLSRFSSFGSARFTGLDAVRGGQPVTDSGPPTRTATPPARRRRPASGVVVLEPESSPTVVTVDDAAANSSATDDALTLEQDVTGDDAGTTNPTADDADPDAPPASRRRTAPEPGSAAERAAARQARLRQQRNDEKGSR